MYVNMRLASEAFNNLMARRAADVTKFKFCKERNLMHQGGNHFLETDSGEVVRFPPLHCRKEECSHSEL